LIQDFCVRQLENFLFGCLNLKYLAGGGAMFRQDVQDGPAFPLPDESQRTLGVF